MIRFNRNRSFQFVGASFMWLCMMVIIFRPEQTNELQKKWQISDPKVECLPNCKIPSLENGTQFFEYFKNVKYNCTDQRFFGVNDGSKGVCMDPVFNITPGDCHVLSFGINNEWSFDDAFDHFGCKVYSFDPTMNVKDHQRSPNIRFLNLGIGNIKAKRKVGMDAHVEFFEVDRYENILERLGLTNTPIDYIKMDVELSELDFFQDVFRNSPHLLKNIKQLAMELHHGYFGEGVDQKRTKENEMGPTSAFNLFWQYFHELHCSGLNLINSRRVGKWTEVVWGRI